jgi:hypothetical protein
MNRKTLLAHLAMTLIAAMALFAMGSGSAQAQCNAPAPGCPFITIDVEASPSGCPAPIARFECVGGAMVAPTLSPYGPGTTFEPCPCPNGLAAIWVAGMRIIPGVITSVNLGPGCCYRYDIQFLASGCVRIKITPCP